MKAEPIQSKYLISIHQPRLWFLSVLGVLLGLAAIVFVAYEYGRYVAGFDQAEYDQQVERLSTALARQTAAKEKALRDNVRLSRGSDIEKDASSKISDTLAACEDERVKMKEELTFYHNIVAPRKSQREIQVNKVSITSALGGVFNYKVVLIQVGKHDYVQRGYIELSFTGKDKEGKEVRLALPKVSVAKTTNRQKFGFKYFQNFEGGIRFPDGFEPISLHIKAQPKSSRVPRVNKSYTWAELIAGGNETNVGQE